MSASQRFWREVRGYGEALIVAFLIVTFLFTTVGVVGRSMRPNLYGGNGGSLVQNILSGDRVFIPKYDTWLRRMNVLPHYQRGEIVVVREPKNAPTAFRRTGIKSLQNVPLIKEIPAVQGRPFFIKRLVGLPGDRIKVVAGEVFVNGHKMDQGFITDTGEITPFPLDFPRIIVQDGEITHFQGISDGTFSYFGGQFRPVPIETPNVQLYYGETLEALAPLPDDVVEGQAFVHDIIVPEGHYFVMGDNRSNGGSEDSRYFGPIDSITVAGRATAIIWPPMRQGERNWRVLSPPEAFDAIPED